ncbi:ABC transporter substrate-binding protein [Bosea thiooxidans]|uniref:ABC transporter substrate-binding protein n=1 Tax=Bosea thiooxidans TaxID=53254 RepID=A0A0Q3PJR9_9HYPH|nr:ABC transporter substrate-binding protein [Bosea thiooxidans]KQK29966.1 ABC transporter substrate-binding protein [Bosea thiooxidans]SKB69773.1 iron(III) transport system substrate-binding protein [Bosea thiooxidans]
MQRKALSAFILAAGLTGSGPALAVEGKLVLYTSQPNTDAQQTVDAFKAKYPKVDISFVRDGTPRVMAKIKAEFEAGAPQADILLIADSVTMEGLKKDDRLLAHDKADVSAYPAGVHDPRKMWFATKLITTGIVYNTKATMTPSSWTDLTKPEAKNQLAMPSPLNSGAALIHTITLTSNLKDGWGFYEKLKENGTLAAGANGDILRQVATGEKLYGMIVDFMPIREKAKGAPVAFVFPSEGVSAVSEPVAILKTTKNPEAAKAFIDFLLSKDGQELALKQGYVAAHPDVALPAGYPARSAIKLMAFDAAKALAEESAARKRFGAIFE